MNDNYTNLLIENAIKNALANIMFEDDYVLINAEEIKQELANNKKIKILIKRNEGNNNAR